VQWGIDRGALLAVQASYLVLAAQVIPLILRFNDGTRERFKFWPMLFGLPTLLFAACLFIGGAVAVFQDDFCWAIGGALAVAAGASLAWATYAWWYEHGPVDLCVQKRR
jgi:hypothetical protein